MSASWSLGLTGDCCCCGAIPDPCRDFVLLGAPGCGFTRTGVSHVYPSLYTDTQRLSMCLDRHCVCLYTDTYRVYIYIYTDTYCVSIYRHVVCVCIQSRTVYLCKCLCTYTYCVSMYRHVAYLDSEMFL